MQVVQPSIPDKTYYKIGEVAKLANLKTSVLRFWEMEFTFLCPEKSSAGQRLYTKQDIDLVNQIKELLYKEKYTIEGVRKKFGSRRPKQPVQLTLVGEGARDELLHVIRQLRQELQDIRAVL